MPANIRRFVWLWWGSVAISLIAIPLLPPPSSSELELGITRPFQMAVAGGVSVTLVAVVLPFFWLAVWRRRNWARWLLLAVFVASIPLIFVPVPSPAPGVDSSWQHLPSPVIIVGWLSLFSQAAAFYFLFTGDARAWFRKEISNGPVGAQ
jgi:hypothetical protein